MGEIEEVVKRALWGIANDFVNELVLTVPVDTGALKLSVHAEVKEGVIFIKMLNYGLDIEFGTNPHYVDPEELKDWAKRKLGDESAAYGVSKGILRKGTRPQPFVRTAVNTKLKSIVLDNIKRQLS